MPYKNREDRLAYSKGWKRGYRKATIDHLGGKCAKCGETNKLEVHHITPLNRRKRTMKDLKDLSILEVRCNRHHTDRRVPL